MFIKIISKSTDFPDYFFNEYIGLECEVERMGETNTKGELTGQRQPCYYVKTGLSEIPLIAVPIINADEVIITTKAAKCPKCGKYHMIALIKRLDKNDLREFNKLMKKGFDIIHVTTQQARDNFGFC
jgi:ssDNA-binding Zn-finger/Zn-ribbon topoisomerase 1